jgi:hypothetical protein
MAKLSKSKKTKQQILSLLRAVKENKKGNQSVVIGKVTNTESDLFFKQHGINVKGFSRIIDKETVKHVMKGHPNITDADFLLIDYIIKNSDVRGLGKYKDTIVYKTTLAYEYFYIEFIMSKRKELLLRTFYKNKIKDVKN